MPVIVPKGLPAEKVLADENIFVMNDHRAITQDIRPLRIGILNLMPKKIETEIHFLRMLSNSPLHERAHSFIDRYKSTRSLDWNLSLHDVAHFATPR